jgi:hypothetical protein
MNSSSAIYKQEMNTYDILMTERNLKSICAANELLYRMACLPRTTITPLVNTVLDGVRPGLRICTLFIFKHVFRATKYVFFFSNRYPKRPDAYSFLNRHPEHLDTDSFSNKYPERRHGYKSGCGLEILTQFQAAWY